MRIINRMLISLLDGTWYLALSTVNKKVFGAFFNPIKVLIGGGGGGAGEGGPAQGLGIDFWLDLGSRVI